MKNYFFEIMFGILLVGLVGILAQNATNVSDDTQNNSNGTAVCDSDNLNLCSGESECSEAEGYWYNSVCNEEEQEDDLNETDEDEAEENWERTQNKTRIRERENITFTPWQKRNESECLEGCKCAGAVVSCPTETGKIITITAGESGNVITITIDKIQVDTELEIEADNNTNGKRSMIRIKVILTNGETKEIIMPDIASEKALKRLRLKNCVAENECFIKLKEVDNDKNKQLVYEVQAERHSRILWLFSKKMEVRAQVNAETGELIRVKKPWWAFLASESEE